MKVTLKILDITISELSYENPQEKHSLLYLFYIEECTHTSFWEMRYVGEFIILS